LQLGNRLISPGGWNLFRNLNLDGILDLLKRDKKTEGAVLKLATLRCIGKIEFVNLRMDSQGEAEIKAAAISVIEAIGVLRDA
jgi:hypothetical protein